MRKYVAGAKANQVKAVCDIYTQGELVFCAGEWMDVCEDQEDTNGRLRVHNTHDWRVLIARDMYSVSGLPLEQDKELTA